MQTLQGLWLSGETVSPMATLIFRANLPLPCLERGQGGNPDFYINSIDFETLETKLKNFKHRAGQQPACKLSLAAGLPMCNLWFDLKSSNGIIYVTITYWEMVPIFCYLCANRNIAINNVKKMGQVITSNLTSTIYCHYFLGKKRDASGSYVIRLNRTKLIKRVSSKHILCVLSSYSV